ncbi:hypothetical protein SGLAM104S_06937 [Streptomyces glaucescens]
MDRLEHLDKHLADELAQVARETIRDELKQQTRKQRRTAMLYAASGTVALYAGAALALAVGLALDLVMPDWAAALITAALLAVAAYALRGAARQHRVGAPLRRRPRHRRHPARRTARRSRHGHPADAAVTGITGERHRDRRSRHGHPGSRHSGSRPDGGPAPRRTTSTPRTRSTGRDPHARTGNAGARRNRRGHRGQWRRGRGRKKVVPPPGDGRRTLGSCRLVRGMWVQGLPVMAKGGHRTLDIAVLGLDAGQQPPVVRSGFVHAAPVLITQSTRARKLPGVIHRNPFTSAFGLAQYRTVIKPAAAPWQASMPEHQHGPLLPAEVMGVGADRLQYLGRGGDEALCDVVPPPAMRGRSVHARTGVVRCGSWSASSARPGPATGGPRSAVGYTRWMSMGRWRGGLPPLPRGTAACRWAQRGRGPPLPVARRVPVVLGVALFGNDGALKQVSTCRCRASVRTTAASVPPA